MVRETRHLWVGNLPHTIREDRILEHFKRYGKVQSVKILPKKEDESGTCATVAFIDIKSAAKAHNADNKIDERTLKTDYYEPPASSTASSAIFIHERDDTLVRASPAPYASGRPTRYQHGLPEDRNYERPGHYYERVTEREPYLRRPIGMGYHDEDNYQGRAKSRDRYVRSTSGSTYTEGTERNQSHFRAHNARPHFEQTRYPVGDQYTDERDVGSTTPRLNRRTNNAPAASVVPSVASPPPARSESRPRRVKRRSPSRTPSGSRSNSRSRSRSRSTSGSRSSSSSSKLRSSSSDSSGRSRSPSKSRSPATSYGSQSNAKGSRLDRPASAIANPSSTPCYLPSAVTTSAINCTPTSSQGSVPTQSCMPTSNESSSEKDEKKPLGICVRNLPVRSTDTSLKDGLFHEYKKHGKVTMVKVIGQGTDRYAVVCFKKPEDVDKALEVSKDKLFFGCKIEVTAHEGLDAEDNEFRPLEAELDEFHPKATRTLFIGNLEKDITTAELRKHFDQFGEIIEIDIKKQGSATSYAFIQYSDIGSVVKAMRKLDGENLGANRIKLGFGKSMPTNCVWLDGIVDTISEKFLARHFSRFGLVAYAAIDREKGHALVFYDSVEFAQIAVSEMRGRILGGKKLQVDFASRECQTTFFDKLEMTGQMVPGDRPWERRERRGAEFEIVRGDDRDARVGFENRVYPRYEGQTRSARGNFRGIQRAGFTGRGRGQGFSARYEVYHDEFGERRHRYNSREESGGEGSAFDGKIDRVKYGDSLDCTNRKRNKLRNSISDQESHHSQSPPRSRHQSRSTSPVSKERKSLKDRLHHRIKSPGSHNSSQVSSPCRESAAEEPLDIIANDYRELRQKNEGKIELPDGSTDISFPLASPKSNLMHDGPEKIQPKIDNDPFRRRSVDSEILEENTSASEQLSQIERKRRLLASAVPVSINKDTLIVPKSANDRAKLKTTMGHCGVPKPIRVNCVSGVACDEVKSDVESGELQEDCVKEKPRTGESANTELKYLQKKQVHILHLLEQLHEGVNSSDTEGSVDSERLSRKKQRSSSSCVEINMYSESDISKAVTKDECNAKLLRSEFKDHNLCNRGIKTENVDSNNCLALSLDSFIFRKHLDPRKGYDQQTLSLTSVSSLQKCRRISTEKEELFVPSQGMGESILCVPSTITTDVAWKKQCAVLSDALFSNNDDELSSLTHCKIKEENMINDIALGTKKTFLTSSSGASLPLELPKNFVSMRTFPDSSLCHEIKRERDISPLSLPLPKFAASLRSPKSSPSILTSPKSSAHSPRAGHSPSSFVSNKGHRVPEILQDIQNEKKTKEVILEEKVNGASISPMDVLSPLESQLQNELPDVVSCLEPIQSPKNHMERNKESNCTSDSDFSPVSSPNRPSIEDRIKALDEKFNAWSGSARPPVNNIAIDVTPPSTNVEFPKSTVKKRSRFNFLAPEIRPEPSDIVKSLLAKSTIFDQDSKRLQHIDEKYEPLSVKMDASPKVKPTFRTKAAAKEFSTPIAPSLQTFNQSVHPKPASSILATQSIMSPPTTPQSATSNTALSPITPPLPHYNQMPSQLFTPCSPHIPSLNVITNMVKNTDDNSVSLCKETGDQAGLVPRVFNAVKPKLEVENLKPVASTICSIGLVTHGLLPNSLPNAIKKEHISLKENMLQAPCKDVESKLNIKKEMHPINTTNIPLRKDNIVTLTKDQALFKNMNSVDHGRKESCERSRVHLREGGNQWKESTCKDSINEVDASAKTFPILDSTELQHITPATKQRVSSIDSNESDSGKSYKSLESSRESQDITWCKQEVKLEPESKRPKLCSSKSDRDRSPTPTPMITAKKCEKKEKNMKSEKLRTSNPKTNMFTNSEKEEHELKYSSKNEFKDKTRSDNHKSRDEKRSKSRENKGVNLKNEQKSKSHERRNSEKDSKSGHSSSSKSKKDHNSNRSEKQKNETKPKDKKSGSGKSKSKKQFDFFIEEEPVYFSMYDKVKARSSKTQTMKHQAKDLETMRQKFSRLKQSRAKREEKSKSIDRDTDKDSDSASHHSSDSDTQTKTTKAKQQRKRKLVIESSSDDDNTHNTQSRMNRHEKDFSDTASDSEFDCKIQQKQASGSQNSKNRKKKPDIIESDSSGSESHFPVKSQSSGKKKSKSKHIPEKFKKLLKSDNEISETETLGKSQSKEKEHKRKKVKKDKSQERKSEKDTLDNTSKKVLEEAKISRKKSHKEDKQDFESSSNTSKREETVKEKVQNPSSKEKKQNIVEPMEIEESEKYKPYNKKKKKSKKTSKNKEKRLPFDKNNSDFILKKEDESESKSSLPILLSPKPNSPMHDKPLSPPCLQVGNLSENDFKSDFSDFDFESHRSRDIDLSADLWNAREIKSESTSEKISKTAKKKDHVFSPLKLHSEITHRDHDQDSSLPLLLEKSESKETEKRANNPTFPGNTSKSSQSVTVKKEKESTSDSDPHKNRNEKHEALGCYSKHDDSKNCRDDSGYSKDERRKKKFKKQYKDKKKKMREEVTLKEKGHSSSSNPVPPSTPLIFESLPDNDSRLSDIRLDEEIAEEARRLEQELLAASEETSTFGDDGPIKREEKPLERRFEEEAAKETRRLEAELFSTARESWHMKEKPYGPELHTDELCTDDKQVDELSVLTIKEDIFAGLELHSSSIGETSQHDSDIFLTGHSDADQYKLEDKDATNEIEDQRQLEDVLAVSALLQAMNSGEISAPELTKETDYLEPLMNTHPEDTMNYLLPDEGDNSLHIVDNSPEVLANEGQDDKLENEGMLLSPSSNSEPPALEISNIEDPIVVKEESEVKSCQAEPLQFSSTHNQTEDKVYPESRIVRTFDLPEACPAEVGESKPPVIDIPSAPAALEPIVGVVSPKAEGKRSRRKRWNERYPKLSTKEDTNMSNNEDIDDRPNTELMKNQLVDFEDITMDTTDSKDDNPPILLPVDLPRSIVSMPEYKAKGHFETPPDKKLEKVDKSIIKASQSAPCTSESVIVRAPEICKEVSNNTSNISELEPKEIDKSATLSLADQDVPCNDLMPLNDICQNSNDTAISNIPELYKTDCETDLANASSPQRNLAMPSHELKNNDPESQNISDTCKDILDTSTKICQPSETQIETPVISYPEILQLSESPIIKELEPELGTSNDSSTIKTSNPRDENTDSTSQVEPKKHESNIKISESTVISHDAFMLDVFGSNQDSRGAVIFNTSEINKLRSNSVTPKMFDHDKIHSVSNSDLNISEKDDQTETSSTLSPSKSNKETENSVFNQELFTPIPEEEPKTLQLPSMFNFPTEQLFSESIQKPFNDTEELPSSNISNISESTQDTKSGDLDFMNTEKTGPLVSCPTEDVAPETIANLFPATDNSGSLASTLCKVDAKSEYDVGIDQKSKSADVESVSSDTTDITFPDTKTEIEINQLTSSEEQMQEDVCPIDELEIDEKQKLNRPRRGRRAKTKRSLESSLSLPKYETPVELHSNPSPSKMSSKRVRPTSSERARRSLRTEVMDQVTPVEAKEVPNISESKTEPIVGLEQEETTVKVPGEETNSSLVIDTSIAETDCSNEATGASHVEADVKLPDKTQHTKGDEPKRRRGRKKKASGDHQGPGVQPCDKTETKPEEADHLKDFHRPKESRFWLSLASEKEQKQPSKAPENSRVFDVFEFRDSEDEELTFERDLQSSVKERLHDSSKSTSVTSEQKPDIKAPEAVPEKEKKIEESKQKTPMPEERDFSGKEYITEVNQHRKISITIRLHQKDGQDGTSAGTAEVVKTSETLNFEETKTEISKPEKVASTKQESTINETPYNGPCKSTRKSTRLMIQAARSSVDEVIEEVVKGNYKPYNFSAVEPIPTRVTRRSRASRRSEENISTLTTETFEDPAEEKNKNEPVFFILDNTVKDISDTKKVLPSQPVDVPPVSETTSTTEPDRIPDRIATLRSFRITRSTASKLETHKENSSASSNLSFSGAINESDSLKKEHVTNLEEKKDTPTIPKDLPKENSVQSASQEVISYRPPLPVLKVELPRVVVPGAKEIFNKIEKGEDNEEDSDSRSSPTVLIDPVTGFLAPVHKVGDAPSDLLENPNRATPTSETKIGSSQVVSDLSDVSTSSVTSIKSTVKTQPSETPVLKEESVQSKSVPQDLVSTGKATVDLNTIAPQTILPQISTTQKCITPSAGKAPLPSETCTSLDTLSALEREVEDLKASARKPQTCSRVGVLTACNTITPSLAGISAVVTTCSSLTRSNPPTATPTTTNTTMVPLAVPLGQPLSGWPLPTTTSATLGLPTDKHAPATTFSVAVTSHSSTTVPSTYQQSSRTMVTAVVTLASSGNMPLKAQTKCMQSISAGLPVTTISKTEVSTAHVTTMAPLTSFIESASCTNSKTITSNTVVSQHSLMPVTKIDTGSTTIPTVAASVNTTWSNSKLSSGSRSSIASDVATRHLNAIQSNPVNPPLTMKSESRSAQISKSGHSHAKSTAAFLQQAGIPLSPYETSVHSGAHALGSSNAGGVIAELLQNPQLLQQHKDYFAAASSGQFQERIQGQIVRPATPVASGIPPDVAARLGNPTPPHTPTPPVTSSGHSLQPSELHNAHVAAGLHLRHQSQPALIGPPHNAMTIHASDLSAFVQQQIIYAATHPHYAAIHPDLRAQQEAQARAAAAAMGISSRFAYPSIPPSAVSSNNFRQPHEPRVSHSSSADVKSEIKPSIELSKGIHESRGADDKVHHTIKPIRIKKEEKELKVIHSDCRDDHDVTKTGSAHEKHPSTTAVTLQNVNLRQQHAHYSAIRQLSPHLTVSPHERITDSPVVANLYATGQSRVPPIPIAGQIDDLKTDSAISLQQTHHTKGDNSERDIKPPAAHQAHPSTIPYHTLDATVHPAARQTLLGVPQVGSPAPGYVDRSAPNQSSHSPSSHSYKKDSGHSQTNAGLSSLHNTSSDKRTNQDISKKIVHARTSSHQGSSISPGPAGLGTAHSPLPWPPVIQTHNPHHHPIGQSTHVMIPPSEQPSHRTNPHVVTQMGSEVPVHAPPPAHAMSQPTNVPRTLPQTPPHASQVPQHGDAFILQRYPVMWQGLLALKNDQAAVQMHFVSGNPSIARASLPPMVEGETAPVRIAQRMRLEQTQLEGVARKMQMMDEHCILMALPCGKDHMDVLQQSSNLKNGFINYLQQKQAAGIVNAAPPGSQQPAYVIHIFPSCEFSDNNLARIAPDLLHIICDITHLVIIIATV